MRAKDPARLMAGGNTLLREEQQRNKVNKMLPKLELELCNLIGEWEAAYGKAFLIHGVGFAKYVQEQREKHTLRLELEKQARNAAKSKSRTRLGATRRDKIATVSSVSKSKRAEPGFKRNLCLEDPPALQSPRRGVDPPAWRSPRRDNPGRGASVQVRSHRTASRTPAGGKINRIKTRIAESSNFTCSTVTSVAFSNDARSSTVTSVAFSNDAGSSTVTSVAFSNDTRSTVNRSRTKTASVVEKTKATARDRRISSESSASNGPRGFRRG